MRSVPLWRETTSFVVVVLKVFLSQRNVTSEWSVCDSSVRVNRDRTINHVRLLITIE